MLYCSTLHIALAASSPPASPTIWLVCRHFGRLGIHAAAAASERRAFSRPAEKERASGRPPRGPAALSLSPCPCLPPSSSSPLLSPDFRLSRQSSLLWSSPTGYLAARIREHAQSQPAFWYPVRCRSGGRLEGGACMSRPCRAAF